MKRNLHTRKPAAKLGKVILVGAGPGDPGLITVAGLEAIRQADVILYDLLISPELMEMFPPGAETIFVGKEAGTHFVDQAETNTLLVAKAKPGQTVVRLKGGDPYTFGRGGEEAEACAKAGIPFEVVPGVTSGLAAPAYAGIPVTHRDASSSIALITGHRRADGTVRTIPAPRADTLIYYMGVRTLPMIVKALRRERWPAHTPVAMVHRGTTPRQQVVAGTLANIVARATQAQIRHPALIVVGKVAAYRRQLRWFEDRPLLGRRIFIAQSLPEVKELRDALYRLGAEVTLPPSPGLRLLPQTRKLDAALKNIRRYEVLLFAHPLAVQVFFERLSAAGKDARTLAPLQIAVYGRAAQTALKEHLMESDLVIPLEFSEKELAPLRAKRILWPDTNLQSKIKRPTSPQVGARHAVPLRLDPSLIVHRKMNANWYDTASGPDPLLAALAKIRAKIVLVPAFASEPPPPLAKLPTPGELIIFPTRQAIGRLLSQVILPIYAPLAAIGSGAITALEEHGLKIALPIRSTRTQAAVQSILKWSKQNPSRRA